MFKISSRVDYEHSTKHNTLEIQGNHEHNFEESLTNVGLQLQETPIYIYFMKNKRHFFKEKIRDIIIDTQAPI